MYFFIDTHKKKKSDSFLFLHLWQLLMQTVYPFCSQELLEQLFASFAVGILIFPKDD